MNPKTFLVYKEFVCWASFGTWIGFFTSCRLATKMECPNCVPSSQIPSIKALRAGEKHTASKPLLPKAILKIVKFWYITEFTIISEEVRNAEAQAEAAAVAPSPSLLERQLKRSELVEVHINMFDGFVYTCTIEMYINIYQHNHI